MPKIHITHWQAVFTEQFHIWELLWHLDAGLWLRWKRILSDWGQAHMHENFSYGSSQDLKNRPRGSKTGRGCGWFLRWFLRENQASSFSLGSEIWCMCSRMIFSNYIYIYILFMVSIYQFCIYTLSCTEFLRHVFLFGLWMGWMCTKKSLYKTI